jgi:TetR/AcrR family transcriptional regulator, tetracycline repressor protein
MRHRREDVVGRALAVLDDYGLADLTMRRLGAELGVQPSALYHHFPNKQALLAAVADELLAR